MSSSHLHGFGQVHLTDVSDSDSIAVSTTTLDVNETRTTLDADQIVEELRHVDHGDECDSDMDADDEEAVDLSLSSDTHDKAEAHRSVKQTVIESTFIFCTSLNGICGDLVTMISITFTQTAVYGALYLCVPLHVKYNLHGGEILTGLIYLNHGFAYLTIRAAASNTYAFKHFTAALSAILNIVALSCMMIFTNYFVWLMGMFVQGISLGILHIATQSFVAQHAEIAMRTSLHNIMCAVDKLAMFCGFALAGVVAEYASVAVALAVCIAFACGGLLVMCTTSSSRMRFEEQLQQHDTATTTATAGADTSPRGVLCFDAASTTLFSICVFSFGLTFVSTARLLLLTLQCMQVQCEYHHIGYINGLSFIVELLLMYIARYVLYNYGRRYTLIPSFVAFGIALFVLPLAHSVRNLYHVTVLFGVAGGLSYMLLDKVAIDVAPSTHLRDTFLNLYYTLSNVARMAAPICVTILCQLASTQAASLCCIAVVTLSLLWSACIMTDPKVTGKRYEMLDLDKSYMENVEEESRHHGGVLIKATYNIHDEDEDEDESSNYHLTSSD